MHDYCPCLGHLTRIYYAQKLIFRRRQPLHRKERLIAKHTGCTCCNQRTLAEIREKQLALLHLRGLDPDPAVQRDLWEESINIWEDRYFDRARRRRHLSARLSIPGNLCVALRPVEVVAPAPDTEDALQGECVVQFDELYQKLEKFVFGSEGNGHDADGATRHWVLCQLEERHPMMARAFWAWARAWGGEEDSD